MNIGFVGAPGRSAPAESGRFNSCHVRHLEKQVVNVGQAEDAEDRLEKSATIKG